MKQWFGKSRRNKKQDENSHFFYTAFLLPQNIFRICSSVSLILAALRDCYTLPSVSGSPPPNTGTVDWEEEGACESVFLLTKPLEDSISDNPSSLRRIIALNSSFQVIQKCPIKKHLSNHKNYSYTKRYLAFQHPEGRGLEYADTCACVWPS